MPNTLNFGTIDTGSTALEADYSKVAPIGTGKFVAVYRKSSNSYIYAKVGTFTAGSAGAVISWGTEAEIVGAATTYDMDVASLGTDKFVVSYYTANKTVTVKVCTVSTTTITVGAESTNETVDCKQNKICMIGTDKFAVASHQLSGRYLYATCGTVSGTTVTFGSSASYDTDPTDEYGCSSSEICPLATDKFLLTYERGSSVAHYVIAGSISTRTITLGTRADVDFVQTAHYIAQLGTDKAVIVYNNSNTGKAHVITASGTGLTVNAASDCANVNNVQGARYVATDSFVWFYRNTSNAWCIALCSVSSTTVTFGTATTTQYASYGRACCVCNPTGEYGIQVVIKDTTYYLETKVFTSDAILTPPTVTTQAMSSVDKTTATGNGNITATGGANATRRGFCYLQGSSGDPTTANSVAYDDGDYGTGAYTKGLTGLTANTAYRVRAYATNAAGTSYGATVDLTTLPDVSVPTVTTQAVTDKAQTTGTGNGNITATGGANATRRGVCYKVGASGDPTTADSVAYDDGSYGTGAFTKAITGLTAGTAYRVRAYAVNSAGTGYGATVAYTTQFTTTLTEVIKVVSVYARVGTWLKTLTQVLTVTPVQTKSVTKLLLQSVKVSPVYAQTVAFLKTLSEVIKVVSSSLKQTGKTFVEVITVTPVYANIKALLRTLTESIKVAVVYANIKALLRTLTESVVVVSVMTSGATLYKLFTETLKVVSNKLFSYNKTFLEVIKVVSNKVFSYGKILAETITVVATFTGALVAYKILTETVKVVSSVVKQTGHTFVEQVKVITGFITGLSAYKVLTEVIKVGSNALFRSIKILIEVIVVTPVYGAIKALLRTYTEVVKVAGSITRSIGGRTLSEQVNVVDNVDFLNVATRVYTETIKVVEITVEKAFTGFKILVEQVKVRMSLVFEGVFYKVFTETLTVVDNILKRTILVLTEVVSVVENTIATVLTAIKTLVEQVKVVSSAIYEGVFYKVFSESIKVVDNILRQSVKILTENIVVTTVYGTILTALKTLIEIVKVTGSIVNATTRVLIEVIKVSSLFAYQTIKLFIEVLTVAGSMAGMAIGRIFNEVVKVGDTITNAFAGFKVLTETIVVSATTFFQNIRVFIERVIVTPIYSGAGIVRVFIERLVATDTYERIWNAVLTLTEIINVTWSHLTQWTLSRVYTETVVVVGNVYNQGMKIFTETITVTGQWILGTISKMLIEIVKVGDVIMKSLPKSFTETILVTTNSFVVLPTKMLIEVVKVTSTFIKGTITKLLLERVVVRAVYTKIWTLSRVFVEIVKVVGTLAQLGTMFIFTEVVKVSSSIKFAMARVFKETVVVGWAKIKLVLNGIQVGLWKKVARITNGAWKKISRNDN